VGLAWAKPPDGRSPAEAKTGGGKTGIEQERRRILLETELGMAT